MKDYTGPNTLLSAFRLIRQAIKSSTLSAGDGIEITETAEGLKISLTTPVQGIVNQADFDALPEEQQNKGFYVISDGDGGGGGGESAGEVYSTEETRIGTWIDGKPLYRRAFYKTFAPGGVPISFAFHITDVDTIVFASAYLKGAEGYTNYIVPFYANENLNSFISFTYNGLLYINQKGITSTNVRYANAIVEYTKTTDTPTVSTAEIVAAALDGLPEEDLAALAKAADAENVGPEVTP